MLARVKTGKSGKREFRYKAKREFWAKGNLKREKSPKGNLARNQNGKKARKGI